MAHPEIQSVWYEYKDDSQKLTLELIYKKVLAYLPLIVAGSLSFIGIVAMKQTWRLTLLCVGTGIAISITIGSQRILDVLPDNIPFREIFRDGQVADGSAAFIAPFIVLAAWKTFSALFSGFLPEERPS